MPKWICGLAVLVCFGIGAYFLHMASVLPPDSISDKEEIGSILIMVGLVGGYITYSEDLNKIFYHRTKQ